MDGIECKLHYPSNLLPLCFAREKGQVPHQQNLQALACTNQHENSLPCLPKPKRTAQTLYYACAHNTHTAAGMHSPAHRPSLHLEVRSQLQGLRSGEGRGGKEMNTCHSA